jgi:hypothetical protein
MKGCPLDVPGDLSEIGLQGPLHLQSRRSDSSVELASGDENGGPD